MVVQTQNFLSSLEFNFVIKRIPNVNFTVQSANIPGINSGNAEYPTPFKIIPRTGDKLTYNELGIQFIVNEDFQNFIEIFNWMKGINYPESYNQYKEYTVVQSPYSDGVLTIMNSTKNKNIEITFQDLFPITLGDISLDTKQSEVLYSTCDVTFKHNGYSIKVT